MIKNAIEKIEETDISFKEWIAGFAGVVLIRFLLETFSSPSGAFPGAPDVITMVHYFLFFLGVFLSLVFCISLFTGFKNIKKTTRVLLFGFPIIWLPPIFDLIRSGGGGYAMAYIFTTGKSLWFDFILLGGSGLFGGLTPGIRAEIIAIIIGIFVYIFLKTKNFAKALIGAIMSYCVVFAWLATPSIIVSILDAAGKNPVGIDGASLLVSIFSQSHIAINSIRPTLQMSYPYAAGTLFNTGLAYIFFVVDSLLIVAWLFVSDSKKGTEIFKNSRPSRMVHYLIMLSVGAITAVRISSGGFSNWVDVIGAFVLLATYLCAWLLAVGINDLEDLKIDSIVHKNRPLVSGLLTSQEIKDANIFFVIWLLIGGAICGYWTFFLVIVFTACYYLYSAEPLRLKRLPGVATIMIALASLVAAMSGFYFLSSSKFISDFPQQLALIIVLGIFFGANIKDLKDYNGDRADGIKTIPVVFGEKRGGYIIATALGISFFIIPLVLGEKLLLIPSLFFAAMAYVFVLEKPYREWKIFTLYLVYVVAVGAIILY